MDNAPSLNYVEHTICVNLRHKFWLVDNNIDLSNLINQTIELLRTGDLLLSDDSLLIKTSQIDYQVYNDFLLDVINTIQSEFNIHTSLLRSSSFSLDFELIKFSLLGSLYSDLLDASSTVEEEDLQSLIQNALCLSAPDSHPDLYNQLLSRSFSEITT